MLFYIFSVNCLAKSLESTLIVHSPKTPGGLRSFYQNTSSIFISSSSGPFDLSSINSPSFIIDISLDPSLFPFLDSLSSYFQVPYLTITKTPDFQPSSKGFFIFPPNNQEAAALMAMIKYFRWKKFSIISSNIQENINILKIFSDFYSDFQMKKYIYDKNITEEKLDVLVKRLVKAAGVKNLVVLDKGDSLEMCLKILKIRKIDKFGNYFLVGFGNYQPGIEGAVELAYEVGKDAGSVEQFYIESISYVINKLNSFTFNDFNRVCNKNFCLKNFFIVNIKNGYKEIVGTVNKTVKLTKPLLFPGNNSNLITEKVKYKLPVMISNGTVESNGVINTKTSYSFNGALYAAELVNLDKDLEDFEFVFIPTDCGNLYYNLSWTMSCLSKSTKNLGLAYISGFWSESSLATSLSLKAMKVFLPQISTSSASGFMNNKTLFPEFLKMTGDGYEILRNSLHIFKFFNWNNVIYITGNGTLDKLRNDTFVTGLEDIGIKVINSKEYRYFPLNYTRDDFEKFRYLFEYIRDTKCRILFLMITSRDAILEGLYDVGLRRGDLVIISYIKAFYAFEDEQDIKFTEKHLELLDGSLLMSSLEFESNYGKKLEKELRKKFSPIHNMCNTFDTFLTISNSLKYLIYKGEDYENPHFIIEAMRSQRFAGCTGDVFFKDGENSRVFQWTAYYQMVVNPTTKEVDYVQFLVINKYAVLAARIINEPAWATDEDSIPSNYRIKGNCVYSRHKQRSINGLLMLHIISIILFIVTAIVAYFSQKFFDYPIPQLFQKTLPSYQDVIYQFFFICEFFQILILEPKTGIISNISREYIYFFGLDMLTFYNFEFSQYWIFQIWLIVGVLIYSCTVGLSIFIIKKFQNIVKSFELVIENALPFIGHISFMPIILMFMNIYRCEEGLTDEITDSFLSRDCSEYCYKGKHMNYMIISSFSLIIFLIISTFFRPLWQTVQVGLRLRTSSKYLSVLSISQLLLVLLKVNIEPYSKMISGYLRCGIILCLAFITFKMKPFNYGKIVQTQITVLFMSFWVVLVSTLFEMVSIEKFFILALVIGMCFVYVIGSKISQNSCEVFISDEPKMIPELIKFQFSANSKFIKPESRYRIVDESENGLVDHGTDRITPMD